MQNQKTLLTVVLVLAVTSAIGYKGYCLWKRKDTYDRAVKAYDAKRIGKAAFLFAQVIEDIAEVNEGCPKALNAFYYVRDYPSLGFLTDDCIDKNRREVEIQISRIRLMRMNGKIQESFAILDSEANTREASPEAWFEIGSMYKSSGKKNNAALSFFNAGKVDPNNLEFVTRAILELSRMKEWKKAAELATPLLEYPIKKISHVLLMGRAIINGTKKISPKLRAKVEEALFHLQKKEKRHKLRIEYEYAEFINVFLNATSQADKLKQKSNQ